MGSTVLRSAPGRAGRILCVGADTGAHTCAARITPRVLKPFAVRGKTGCCQPIENLIDGPDMVSCCPKPYSCSVHPVDRGCFLQKKTHDANPGGFGWHVSAYIFCPVRRSLQRPQETDPICGERDISPARLDCFVPATYNL